VKHRSVITLLVAAGLLVSKLSSTARAQTCAATDIGGRTICDHEGADCSPPSNGKCRTAAIGCICIGSQSKEELKCQRAIGKAYVKFASSKLKAFRKCQDDLAKGGDCNLSGTYSKTDLELEKARAMVEAACGGVDFSTFPAGSCANPTGSGATLEEVLSCLAGVHGQCTDELTEAQYGAFVTRCCIEGVCVVTSPKNCEYAGGRNIGPGSCNPNPC